MQGGTGRRAGAMEPSDSADAEASRRERAERAWDRADARYARQVAAAAEAGKLAIRAALIVNSGAALALFLFLVGGFPGGEVSVQLDYPDRIARAIRSFAVGAFLAACAAGAGARPRRPWSRAPEPGPANGFRSAMFPETPCPFPAGRRLCRAEGLRR